MRKKKPMKTMSVRFDPRDAVRIGKLARRRGITSSELVRDATMLLVADAEKDGDV